MPSSRTSLLVALSLACAGLRGFAEDPSVPSPKPAAPQPAKEPRLKEILRDDFQTDTRKNYEFKGDVAWEIGRLTLSENSSIGANIESGPWAEWQFDLDPPSLEKDGDQASMLLHLKLEGARDACVRWVWTRENGQNTGRVQILDTALEKGETKFSVVREFPIPEVAGSWRIELRHGLILVVRGEQPVGAAYLKNGDECPNRWNLISQKRSIHVQRVHLEASPRPRVLTLDDEKTLAQAHAFNEAGLAFSKKRQFSYAVPNYLQVCETFKRVLGEEHPSYAASLINLAQVYGSMGEYAKAEPLYLQSCEILRRQLGEIHPDYGRSLSILAGLYESMAAYARAEPLYVQTLAIRKRVQGEEHPDYAAGMNNLAQVYRAMGEYSKAEPLYLRSRDILKQSVGEDHPYYAMTLGNLAAIYQSTGEFAKAEPLFIQSRDILKRLLGDANPDYATSLNNLAALYLEMQAYAKAEPLFVQVRDIRKRVLGEEDPRYATSLNNLGTLYNAMGAYSQAEPLYVQARDIYKRVLGEEHPHYATNLDNLAGLYTSMEAYAQAEPLYQQARDIRKRILGEDHPDFAVSLNNLAGMYDSMGEYAKAEPLYLQARDIRKRVQGEGHLDYAGSLNNLARVYVSMGDYAKAEPLFLQARNTLELTMGELHPDYAINRNNLAFTYMSMKAYAKADELFRLALDMKSGESKNLVGSLSESRSQEFVGANEFCLAGLLSNGRQIDGYSGQTAFAAVWKARGIVSRSLSERRRSVENDPEAQKLLAQLQSTQQQLAQWTLMTPTPGQSARRTQRLQELDDEKERLESSLATISTAFRQAVEVEQRTPGDLMHTTAHGTAVIQLLKIPVWEPSSGAKGFRKSPDHYEAFVLTKTPAAKAGSQAKADGYAVAWVHLGLAKSIETSLAEWREQVQQAGGRGVGGVTGNAGAGDASPADVLRTAVWAKIEPHLAGCKSVIIIPDGDLHFLPWGALPGSKPGTYLVEEYAIATAQDGRQLYQTLTAPPLTSEQSLLLVGGVDYDQGDARPTAPPPVIERTTNELPGTTRSRPPSLTKRPVWTALAGTAGETEQVTKLAGMRKAKQLRGSEAQENALRQEMPQARFIHLATHGFFADETFRSAFQQDEAGEQLFGGAKNLVTKKQAGVTYRNPLLLSGIVLAGANQPPQIDTLGLETGQDGILTAEEVVNLDLQQTELVVLSACDTGLGRVGGGEGVFGLQRAFALAGARTTIASLWKVDDAATQTLMAEFYRNMWEKKLPKLEALRQAQLTMLRHYDPRTKQLRDPSQPARPQSKETATKSEALSPFYWAAFTLSGDWR